MSDEADDQGKANSQEDAAGGTMTVADRLRVLACPACGVGFAAPEALWLQRVQEKAPICCPNGHAHVFQEPTPQETLAMVAHLTTALAHARFRADRVEARAALAKPMPSGPLDERELKRRAKTLSLTARRSNQGGVICPVCGSHSMRHAMLARHLLRSHKPELAAAIISPTEGARTSRAWRHPAPQGRDSAAR